MIDNLEKTCDNEIIEYYSRIFLEILNPTKRKNGKNMWETRVSHFYNVECIMFAAKIPLNHSQQEIMVGLNADQDHFWGI